MSDTAGFAALITVAIAWAGFAAVGRRNGWSGVIRHGGGFVVGLVALIVGVILFAPDAPSVSTASPPPFVADQKVGMNIAREQFAYRWNSISQNKIGAIEFTDGAAKIDLGNSQALLLHSLSDKRNVDSVILLFAPQSGMDALDALVNVAAIMGVANPELAPAQRGEILARLRMTGDDADYEFADGERTRTHVEGSVKYYFMRVAGVLMFGAEAPN